MPYKDPEKAKEYNRKYYQENREKILENRKKYCEENKEKILEKSREYYIKNKEAKNEYRKKYYEENIDKVLENRKKYCEENKEEILEKSRKYYKENKEEILEGNKKWREENKEKLREGNKKYRQENKEKIKKYRSEYYKEKYHTDPCYKLRSIVSSSIWHYLKNGKGGESIAKYLPYTIDQLREHLESQFEDWMTWDNHGLYHPTEKRWQIDHIKPQSVLLEGVISMDDPKFRECWALENLQPLEAMENAKKGNIIL